MGLSLRGTTSGAVDINAPAVAGDNTITLPGTNGAANQFYKNSGTAGIVTYSSMVEDSSGNVGIGTDNPTTELQVNHATNECTISLFNAGTKKAALQAQNSFGTILYSYDDEPIIFSVASGTSYSEKLRITSDGYARLTTANARLEWTASSGSNPFIRSIGSGQQELEFNTGSNERLRITSAGKIQVTGTRGGSLQASDNDSLELYTASASSSVNRGSGITFYNHDGSGYEMGGTIQVAKENGTADNTSSYMRFATRTNGSDATERMRITSGGNIGIGNIDPGTMLHISDAGDDGTFRVGGNNAGDTGFNVLYENGGTTYTILKQNYATTNANAYTSIHTGYFTVNTGTSLAERMRIDSSGDLCFGVATAGAVGGITFYRQGSGSSPLILMNKSNSATTTGFSFQYNSSTKGSITYSSTGTSFNTSSDYRLKENVVDITDGITRVKQLSPRRFNFIADDTKIVDGFIAHEAQVIVPECVTGVKDEVDDDGKAVMQGIDQSKLVPLLTAALQEAIAKIETLETQNADLLSRVTALEG